MIPRKPPGPFTSGDKVIWFRTNPGRFEPPPVLAEFCHYQMPRREDLPVKAVIKIAPRPPFVEYLKVVRLGSIRLPVIREARA